MDVTRLREYPGGEVLFGKPQRGRLSYVIFGFTVLYTAYLFIDGRPRVALLAGGALVLLSVPNVLPRDYHLQAIVLRLVGFGYFAALWVAIAVYFPDAPTFFQGNW